MARQRAYAINMVRRLENRWENACDNCGKNFDGGKNKLKLADAKLYIVPRLIFLPNSSIPLILPQLQLHLLICKACAEKYGEPVAVEDRGFFREQTILWNKPISERSTNSVTKFCGYCVKNLTAPTLEALENLAGAILLLPRLTLNGGKLEPVETRGSEIRLLICEQCVKSAYRPLAVEQTWRFGGDILRPKIRTIRN